MTDHAASAWQRLADPMGRPDPKAGPSKTDRCIARQCTKITQESLIGSGRDQLPRSCCPRFNHVDWVRAEVQHFAADVPREESRALEAAQHPISLSILGTPAGVPSWKTIPSLYQVSTNDEAIDPKLQRFFAKRMRAHTIELAASHVSLVSKSGAVAELIERAAGGR